LDVYRTLSLAYSGKERDPFCEAQLQPSQTSRILHPPRILTAPGFISLSQPDVERGEASLRAAQIDPARAIVSDSPKQRSSGRADDVAGIGVHIGARVSALAGPGEVLVTSTVKDLVIGSELQFDDRGAKSLKGVPGDWHLWAAN
jgi:hypothetical protein